MSDFAVVSANLLSDVHSLVSSWLPGGLVRGKEYCCAGINGGAGDSFKVNLTTGKWAEFAGDLKGGDLISLYAAIHNIPQLESLKKLGGDSIPVLRSARTTASLPSTANSRRAPVVPPDDGVVPTMTHPALGSPSCFWLYKTAEGKRWFYVARYDGPDGKTFLPWSWDGEQWVAKGVPEPRPLYNLDKLRWRSEAHVLVVEGEKAADAAFPWSGPYVVTTWPNGAASVKKADWSPLKGRSVLVWPDADKAGAKAAETLLPILRELGCTIKVIDTNDLPVNFDAADCSTWSTYAEFAEWAKPRARECVPPEPEPELEPEPARFSLEPGCEPELDPEDHPECDSAFSLGLVGGKNGPYPTISNVLQVFDNWGELKNMVWYDTFYQRILTIWNSDKPREWSTADDYELTSHLQRSLCWHTIKDTQVRQAVLVHAMKHPRNEPRDWVNSLKWDSHSRAETFLIDCFGADDTEYTRAVSKNWLISMVARLMQPGCKVDNMVILEGGQGKRKSTALETLAGKWFTVPTRSVTEKDFYQEIQGRLIIEFAELDAMGKIESNSVKKVVSNRIDRFRVPYQTYPADFPRQCIFVGTTNEAHYLQDSTGGRRFWPIKTNRIDIDTIASCREQLFAEAIHLFNSGATWWEVPLVLAEEEQEARRDTDPWEDFLESWIDGQFNTVNEFTTNQLGMDALKIDIANLDKRAKNRIGKCMRILGYEYLPTRGSGDQLTKRWIKIAR